MQKDKVSLEEALGYMNFIKNDPNPFDGKEFLPTPSPQVSSFSRNKSPARKGKKIEVDMNDEEKRKNLNKNRAIKRIIETSKEILENNYRYVEKRASDKQSYVTQFNIYMKQYNRLSEQIHSQHDQDEEKEVRAKQQEEEKLESIYMFTVNQDFREVIDVAILKEKISKNNIDLMVDTFKPSLVALTTKELRIFQGLEEDAPYRGIKIFQIENVDYHNQPYIFSVFTITKDKTQGQEYLYFRFDSIKNQDKWDHAIYCNYMTKKIKTNRRYFEIEYPVEVEKREKEIHKREVEEDYEVDRNQILRNLWGDRERSTTNMGTAGMNTDRELPFSESGHKMARFNTENQINTSLGPEDKNKNIETAKHSEQNHNNYFESEKSQSPFRRKNSFKINPLTDLLFINDPSRRPAETLEQVDENEASEMPKEENEGMKMTQTKFIQNDQSKDDPMTINILQVESEKSSSKIFDSILAKSEESQKESEREKESSLLNPSQKRKADLKEKHEKGIILKKSKFFSDKVKIFYLHNEEFEYWDLNEKTMHKEEKKTVRFEEIKKMERSGCTLTMKLKAKEMILTGHEQDLKEMTEWIDLCQNERVSET